VSNLLSVEDLNAFYGDSQVLFDVSIELGSNEVVGIFGRNGMGKTTLLNSLVNRIDRKTGTVTYRGQDVSEWSTHEIIREGIAYVPEEREIFPALSVRENLQLAMSSSVSEEEIEERIQNVFSQFERLRERQNQRGGTLSGGEQQMLAIGRALVTDPDLLLLDEPTEGLAPQIVQDVIRTIKKIRDQDIPILLVEQNLNTVLEVADRVYILEQGKNVYEGTVPELRDDEATQQEFLGVGTELTEKMND